LNGIQEVRSSILLVSTKKTLEPSKIKASGKAPQKQGGAFLYAFYDFYPYFI